jgi:hypothetical protein
MWKLNKPKPVKFVIGILAADEASCNAAVAAIEKKFGKIDLISPLWTFTHTTYYKDELGENAVKRYVSIEKLISPARIAKIKHITNRMEQKLAKKLDTQFARPVNIDPGYIETSKLVLATTKNFSHRIYIGKKMWAEVTLSYVHGKWISYEFTFPDHKEDRYHGFLSQAREKLAAQLKELN